MTTTTDYGSWNNIMGISAGLSPRQYVYEALSGADDPEAEFDLDGIEAELRSRIADALDGTGISLAGSEFIGPWEPDEDEAAAQAALGDWDGRNGGMRGAITAIDLYEFVPRFERTNRSGR